LDVKDGDVIYLVATNPGKNNETLYVNVDVMVNGEKQLGTAYTFDLKGGYTAKVWAIHVNIEDEPDCILNISIDSKYSDGEPRIKRIGVTLPITVTADGQISFDYNTFHEKPDGYSSTSRFWGTGSYDGTVLILQGSWTDYYTGGSHTDAHYLTQEDKGTFRLETRGFWDEPPTYATASTRQETVYGVRENNNQTPEIRVDDLTQLDRCVK